MPHHGQSHFKVLYSEKTTKLCCSVYSYFMVKSKGELYYQSTIWNYSLNLQSKVVRCMVASPQSKSIESEFSKQRGTVVASPLSKIIVWIFKAKGNSVASPLSGKESWRINVLFQVKNMCKCPLNDRCGTTLSGTMSTPVNQSKVLTLEHRHKSYLKIWFIAYCIMYIYNLVFFSVVLAQ